MEALDSDACECVLSLVVGDGASTALTARRVCRAWRRTTDRLLRRRLFADIEAYYHASFLVHRSPLPMRMVLRYAFPAPTIRAPQYRCARCGGKTHDILSCDCAARDRKERRARRGHLRRALLGPALALFAAGVVWRVLAAASSGGRSERRGLEHLGSSLAPASRIAARTSARLLR